VREDCSFCLLAPVNATERVALEAELEKLIALGYKSLKVKVGKDVHKDALRVNLISEIVGSRAQIRVDANRAYTVDEAIEFVSSVSGNANIQLFEQPCSAEDWDANTKVAESSSVPIMLDEPICTLEDIKRAAGIPNVGFCKVKLKRFGSLESLAQGIQLIQQKGMQAILGDGLGCDVCNWMEAAMASKLIDTEGEFNGFLKHKDRLFRNPMKFDDGKVFLPKGYWPVLDYDVIDSLTVKKQVFNY